MSQPVVPRLELRGLTKTFGGARALDRADLTIMPGEVHGLLGSNGSGKSTLIKVLSGFHTPDEGMLRIDGRDVALPIPLGRSESYGLSFVHQNLGLLYEATVLENLIAGDHERLNPWHINWRRRPSAREDSLRRASSGALATRRRGRSIAREASPTRHRSRRRPGARTP